MSRKADSGSSRGFDDVIGVVLLHAALLLLMAQLSFDPHDIGYLYNPPIRPAHNWIGPLGSYIAWWVFLLLGVVGYFLPFLIAVFGAAYMFGFLHYLRERLQWSLLWSLGLLVSLTGLLFLADEPEASTLQKLIPREYTHFPNGLFGVLSKMRVPIPD